MNKYLYDAVTNAFYPLDMQADYEDAGMWPAKGVEVDETLFASFQNPPAGKVRAAGDDGYPEWVDVPPPTPAQYVHMADAKKVSLLNDANSITDDWRTELALGIISDEDKASLISWMQYIKVVKAVDTSTAPIIVWPKKPS